MVEKTLNIDQEAMKHWYMKRNVKSKIALKLHQKTLKSLPENQQLCISGTKVYRWHYLSLSDKTLMGSKIKIKIYQSTQQKKPREVTLKQ